MVDLAKRLGCKGGKAHPFGMVNEIIYDNFDNGGCIIAHTYSREDNSEQVHRDLIRVLEQATGCKVDIDFTEHDTRLQQFRDEWAEYDRQQVRNSKWIENYKGR